MTRMDLTQVGHMPTLPSIPDPTPEQLHRARVAVCARATDADDARDLLQLLGLLPRPEPEPEPPAPAPKRAPWLDSDGHPHVCRHGHVFTAANTRWRREGQTPVCRECDRSRRKGTP